MFGLQPGPCTEHYLGRDTKKHLNNSSSMPELRAKSELPCYGVLQGLRLLRRIRLARSISRAKVLRPTMAPAARAATIPSTISISMTGFYQAEKFPAPLNGKGALPPKRKGALVRASSIYLTILVTRPEPTVRPPSRMAKPRPSSMAIGWISATVISVLSPGITISVPSGRVMTPVTSVVRK
jgi:hypothetical protein